MISLISSASNRLIKDVKQLKNKSKRNELKLYIAEGENIVREAIEHKPDEIKCIFATDKFKGLFEKSEFDVYVIPEYIMEAISDTKSPQGVLALMNMPENLLKLDDRVVYLDNVSDPGNIGTIIRTADAAGINCVILSPECADVYSPKIIRATMGSCFHINIFKEDKYLEALKKLAHSDYNVVVGSLKATKSHFEADLSNKVAICLGNEAHGVSDDLMNIDNICPVKIPIVGKAESLNVSIAGALLMYEALRQRGECNE